MIRTFGFTLLLVLALGCARGEQAAPDTAVSEVPVTETTIQTTSPPTDPSPSAAPIQVTLVDYRIEMPASIPAGPASFQVTNNGSHAHNFEIEGQGVEKEFESNLKPGEVRTMEVDLKPGTYKIYCPVEGHEDRGMSRQLTVS